MFKRFFSNAKTDKNSKRTTSEPAADPTNFGSVLIRLHLVTEEQLKKIVAKQRAGDEKRMGEVACELGFCTPSDIEKAVAVQRDMRGGNEGMAALSFVSAATSQMASNAKEIAEKVRTKTASRGMTAVGIKR